MPNDLSAAHLTTPGGIPYALINPSPTIVSDRNGFKSATAEYRIASDMLVRFLEELFPPLALNGPFAQAPTGWALPGTDLYPSDATSKSESDQLPSDPFSTDLAAPASYDPVTRVTVQYTNYPIYQHSISMSVEFLMIPPTSITFTNSTTATSSQADYGMVPGDYDNGEPSEAIPGTPEYYSQQQEAGNQQAAENPDLPITKLIPVTEHTLVFPRVPRPNFGSIRRIIGCVNNGVVATLNGAASETVLALGMTAKRDVFYRLGMLSPDPWHIELKFAEKVIVDVDNAGNEHVYSWNDYYNPKKAGGGGWQRLTKNGQPMYRAKSFGLLTTQGP